MVGGLGGWGSHGVTATRGVGREREETRWVDGWAGGGDRMVSPQPAGLEKRRDQGE